MMAITKRVWRNSITETLLRTIVKLSNYPKINRTF